MRLLVEILWRNLGSFKDFDVKRILSRILVLKGASAESHNWKLVYSICPSF
jgi:hypothetical protein